MDPECREVISVSEAAKLLHVVPETIRKLIKSGTLEGFKIDKMFRIYKDSLPNYIGDKK